MRLQASPAGIALLQRLKLFDFDTETMIHDATCGLHSGIPPCCVAFFISIWLPAVNEAEITLNNINEKGESIDADGNKTDYKPAEFLESYRDQIYGIDNNIHYIPCPACLLKRKFVKVKSCKCYSKKKKKG